MVISNDVETDYREIENPAILTDHEIIQITTDLRSRGINAVVVGHSRGDSTKRSERFAVHGFRYIGIDAAVEYNEGALSGMEIQTDGRMDYINPASGQRFRIAEPPPPQPQQPVQQALPMQQQGNFNSRGYYRSPN